MIEVLVGLGWLWWGFCGFGAVCAGIWAVSAALKDDKWGGNTLYRDQWLRQHFGEEGRKRWLENLKKSKVYDKEMDCIKAKFWDMRSPERNNACQALIAKLGGRGHRTADGRCEGFVCLQPKYISLNNAWGSDGFPYKPNHADNPYFPCSGNKHHEEPGARDWFAAGYWDPVARADDGVIVDPMEAVYHEMKADIFRGDPGFIRYIDCPDGIWERAWAAIEKNDRTPGKRLSNTGLRAMARQHEAIAIARARG